MKALVTGGCGFIGSHVVDAYIEQGLDVVIVDNLSTGKRENANPSAKLHVTDILSDEFQEVFRLEKPDVVSHHAAQISVPLSVKEPLLDAEVNIIGTLKVLEALRRSGTGRIIFSSTGGAIYGEATEVPTGEEYRPLPASPYAIAKLSAEQYLRYYHDQFGIGTVVLRYGNVFGPRQIPHAEAGVVAIFTEKLLKEEHPVLYHFSDEPRGMIRDYCFVKDIARANVLALKKTDHGTYNIGTGKGTFTLDLYREIVAVLREIGVPISDKLLEPLTGQARQGDIRTSTLRNDKARAVLNWSPAYTLHSGIVETVRWYLKG
jgi:UDP-glucose 4-epimerase